jgi:hypothetical protein
MYHRNAEDYITWTFMLCTPHLHYSGDQVKKNEMDGSCGMYGGEKRCIQGFGWKT